ncbi:myelin protein zero-like protein 2 isoform X1 [Triplophysa dalaica]|uniref:myelin protein zero-like protein 2 isoform X1 n=1 Tax=Triplophysa dalaica TaxID=1582913 RepID=UPI0024E03BDD|nr:myelin protein zero-like protein 2 isoform X1 [Triplophysa dalaica]
MMGLVCAHLMVTLFLSSSGWLCVVGMRVSTAGDVQAVNGTDCRLRCTFMTSAPVRLSSLTVSWSFRPFSPGPEETVLYYHGKPVPNHEGRFKGKVEWAGDAGGRDASIVLRKVSFQFNGTFSCQVWNTPDVHGNVGQVRLRVVSTASFSEIVILSVAIGGSILMILLMFIIITSVRHCHTNKNPQENCTTQPQKERMMW